MHNDTRPAHLMEVRVNSQLAMELETGKFTPLTEVIMIGYRASYEFDHRDDAKGVFNKTLEAHTVRVLVDRKSAKALRDTMDKIMEHLDAMQEVADGNNEAMAEYRAKYPEAQKEADAATTEEPAPATGDDTNGPKTTC